MTFLFLPQGSFFKDKFVKLQLTNFKAVVVWVKSVLRGKVKNWINVKVNLDWILLVHCSEGSGIKGNTERLEGVDKFNGPDHLRSGGNPVEFLHAIPIKW